MSIIHLIPFQTERNPMETKKSKRGASGIKKGILKGTKEMRYWEFRKEFCSKNGWQLRRLDAQIYEVIDSKHQKIGLFRSGEGYFPTE